MCLVDKRFCVLKTQNLLKMQCNGGAEVCVILQLLPSPAWSGLFTRYLLGLRERLGDGDGS